MCSIPDDVKANLDFGSIMEEQLQCATKWCNCRKLSISCSKFCKCLDETVPHIVLVVLKDIVNAILKNTAALGHIVM